ncbi:iron-sulfur cluster assembly accessory protein [Arenimonas sp.]|uniref:HesB/IscA family protein n=1 Tax=Arenimonas sp. TaxID=1872635 RepID=UPI0025F2FFD6|nr:iron-sulfur cluster assembly accessory protein [Arenimonas sp.]
MAITLTPAAANRIRSYQADSPGTLGLRFGVRKSGCTGFAYVIDMASEAGPGDHVFESAGVKVFVDAASLPQVDGTEIDFASQGLNQQFVFRNPNVEDACGCGESFSTKA